MFDIMTGVAITVLVKKPRGDGQPCYIHYAEVDDYLARQEKLDELDGQGSIAGTEFEQITPNSHGDWLNQRDDRYLEYQPIGDKKTKGKTSTNAVFFQFSRGLETARDAWCYSFAADEVENNMRRMISNYNQQVSAGEKDYDATKVSWSSSLDSQFERKTIFYFSADSIRPSMYRPFCKLSVYFDHYLNHRPYQLPQIFPTPEQPNLALGPIGERRKEFSTLMVDCLPDLEMVSKAQWCPLYTWGKLTSDGPQGSLLDFCGMTTEQISKPINFARPIAEQVPLEVGGYRRRDNITDATLAAYRQHYHDARSPQGERISKEDIFFYVYALLHHPEYRERYHADLKKMLPRIPKAVDFWSYSTIGRELADLHINHERMPAYSSIQAEWSMDTPTDEWAKYHVTKLVWAKTSGKAKDLTRLIYNDYLTFSGIPAEANECKIGGRSPLEWMVDRYKITTDKKSGIVNDPNDYCREVGDPAYIAKLVPSLVTVSMRTQELMRALPEFLVDEA